MKVFIFIDNSNTFIQGTEAVAYLENAGQWEDQERITRQLPNSRIDYDGYYMPSWFVLLEKKVREESRGFTMIHAD